MHQRNRGNDAERRQIAAEAARIMAEEGVTDHLAARARAARRHAGHPSMPDRAEIDRALGEYLALFQGDRHPRRLDALRRLALRIMELLGEFEPQLAGSVLEGHAVPGAPVVLHLLGHQAEEVAMALMNRAIPYREGTQRLRFGRNHDAELPTLTIDSDGEEIELVIFAPDGPRQAPRDPVTGGAMRRAPAAALRRLIASEEGPAGEARPPAGDPASSQRRSSET